MANARSIQAGRYREAAEVVIKQLDWVIGYLRQIHKPEIAQALQANRDKIVKRAGLTR